MTFQIQNTNSMKKTQRLGSLLPQWRKHSETQTSLTTSQESSAVAACRERYKTGENFLTLFNPGMQCDYCKDLRRVYMGKAPTLDELGDAFGKDITESWVAIQVRDLSEFSGVNNKISIEQIDMLAKVITATFHGLKATELMHFFLLFKGGKFGKFYGAVDGLAITEALQEFCHQRNERIWQYEDEERKRKEDAERERHEGEVARFRALCDEYGVTPTEWTRNQELFDGTLSPEEIKAELAIRLNRQ